jgi:diaminohydroxyphosphoribosylaminopyrimidine deaminase/5-amino-6-(5-phosphoribosylamino)uracil reductase
MLDIDAPRYIFSRLAVDKAKLCTVDKLSKNPIPRVAIVIARGEIMLGWYAKGVGGQFIESNQLKDFSAKQNAHAEQALLEQMAEVDLAGATAYVTLEPCTKRLRGPCCADLLVNSGIREIHIGNCDPNPDVGALAWKTFHENNISILDFPPELRNESRRDNDPFFRKFSFSTEEQGEASFDYLSNSGKRTLETLTHRFTTSWTNRCNGEIYAVDHEFNVALAKNCTKFEEIDDPSRWFEDCHYTKPVAEGQIVIFRNQTGYALVKILKVKTKTTDSNAELKFSYQIRTAANTDV